MGLKSFVNSRNGRAAIAVSFLGLLGLAISAGFLWLFYFSPTGGDSLEGRISETSGGAAFVSASVVEEENPLPGLPSSTVSIRDSYTDDQPTVTLRYPERVLSSKAVDSLVNVHAFREPEDGSSGLVYDFRYYSSSLSDYEENGAYSEAVNQFLALSAEGVKSVSYSSRPLATGGKELSISVVSSLNFVETNDEKGKEIWSNLLNGLASRVSFEEGARVAVNLADASGRVALKTVFTSEAEAKSRAELDPWLWTTFEAFLTKSSYSFLDAQRLTYSVERTSEDSVLTVVTGRGDGKASDIESRMRSAGKNGEGMVLFPGSFITYLVTSENPVPYATFDSSSRNW